MNKLRLAWFISLVATLGSLYFSEVMGFIPCTLCWYQRILMYTLPVLLGIALYRNDTKIVIYTIFQTVLGFGFGLYHVLLQHTNLFEHVKTCSVDVPCTTLFINWFGFITIPLLSMTAFLLIGILSVLILRENKKTA